MNRFKHARLIQGMTQVDVAKKLGISSVSVSHWENGESFPKPNRLKEIAEVLNTTVEELLCEEGRAG